MVEFLFPRDITRYCSVNQRVKRAKECRREFPLFLQKETEERKEK